MSAKTVITTSFVETQRLGRDFAKHLKGGEVLTLHGDLGSGKTTFVQGLAQGLGISKKIISPTFIILRTYSSEDINFHHIDLYRIKDEKDLEGLGLSEIMDNQKSITAIEWPEKIETMLPKKRIELYFTYLEDDRRQIKITS